MANRPFFQKSVEELEAAYKNNSDDEIFCQSLLDELQHRSTQRALNLKSTIVAANDAPIATKQENVSVKNAWEIGRSEEVREKATSPAQENIEAPRIELGPKPEVTNDPQNILRTWTAMEVLSPQSYNKEVNLVAGDRSRIARFEDADLPWKEGERSRPKKRLYYELILGAVALSPAVEALLKLYADNRPDMPSMKGHCPVASILLDKEGRPLEEDNSFAISSFAWGVPIALKGDLKTLSEWPYREKNIKNALKKVLYKRDRKDEVLPLTKRLPTVVGRISDMLLQVLKYDVFRDGPVGG